VTYPLYRKELGNGCDTNIFLRRQVPSRCFVTDAHSPYNGPLMIGDWRAFAGAAALAVLLFVAGCGSSASSGNGATASTPLPVGQNSESTDQPQRAQPPIQTPPTATPVLRPPAPLPTSPSPTRDHSYDPAPWPPVPLTSVPTPSVPPMQTPDLQSWTLPPSTMVPPMLTPDLQRRNLPPDTLFGPSTFCDGWFPCEEEQEALVAGTRFFQTLIAGNRADAASQLSDSSRFWRTGLLDLADASELLSACRSVRAVFSGYGPVDPDLVFREYLTGRLGERYPYPGFFNVDVRFERLCSGSTDARQNSLPSGQIPRLFCTVRVADETRRVLGIRVGGAWRPGLPYCEPAIG
jgi:hypothetical protein